MVQFFRSPDPMMLVLVAMLLLAAQTRPGMAPEATETLTYDHVHFGVPDPAKAVEWYAKYKEHHIPGTSFDASDLIRDYSQIHIDPSHEQIYFSLYFAMTGLHALHMIIGIGIFSYLLYHAAKGRYTPEYYTPIDLGGLYWHFVDVVWIYLFPLLYLIDRKPLG